MNLALYCIEVENFKTYAGKVTIGPFMPFMAIIGPNGSGKSNLVDAISFALGEKASKLRVKNLSSLIYGAHIGKPIAETASVTLCFKYEDSTFTTFKRVVSRTSQEFILNNTPVRMAEYLSELSAAGLNIKAENFLIYQGKVESIAMMDPKQRTVFFEEISGSKAFKRPYEDLKVAMTNAFHSNHSVLLKQRTFRIEYKEAKHDHHEALKYKQLFDELTKKRIELHLFKLFYNQRGLNKLEEEMAVKQTELEGIQANKKEAEGKLKIAKKRFGSASRKLAELETEIQEKESKMKKVKLPFIKAKEEMVHLSKKLETAQLSLKQALDVQRKHKDTLIVLKTALANVQTEQQEYMESVAEESISQGRDIELEKSQVENYNELKRHAAHISGSLYQKIESLTREQKANQDRKENEMRKCSAIKDKITKKSQEKDDCMKRCQKLTECICSNEKGLQELLVKQTSFRSNSLTCQENIAAIQTELSQITAELDDAHVDTYEMNKKKNNQEVVERLKELFPGVYDRLRCLCEPVHKKFAVPLTRVMGKYLNAIVVDKEITAKMCIQYLKEQMLDPEVFLPLDYIQVKPLQENLRQIGDKNTHLLHDVLNYNPPNIKRAVLFATKSVLVCDTPEKAMSVAFDTPSRRIDVVSLDGTYFQKSGLISGGTADLARKAKQWDEKQMAQMQAQKAQLSKKLQTFLKQSRCQSELNIVDCEIKGMTSRVKLMKADLEKSLSHIRLLDEDLDKLNETLQSYQPQLDDIEKVIEQQSHQLKTLQEQLNSLEDQVFSDFCIRIGVHNIRAFEEAGLKSYEEREKKRIGFEDRKNLIQNQLEYENSVDTDGNIKRWNDEVLTRENALTNAKNLVENSEKLITSASNELKILTDALKEKRTEVDSLESAADMAKKDVRAVDDTIHAVQKQILKIETGIGSLHGSRRSILIHCCVEGIKVPILEGDVNSLIPGRSNGSESGSSTTVSADSQASTSDIIVDYDSLAPGLKNLKGASIKDNETSLNANISKLSAMLFSMGATDLKVDDKLAETSEKIKEANSEIDNAQRQAKKKMDAFEKVKKQRCEKFNDCFDFVSSEIDSIYKQLTKSSSAMALLTAENAEEPYLGGISYCCIAPGKPCKPMQSLSGGEKTIASLALVIALHRYGKAPYLILDEIDAALDNTNIANVAEFFNTNKNQFHTIAISLQPNFYSHADALVGVTVNQHGDSEDPGSAVFLFDLRPYEH